MLAKMAHVRMLGRAGNDVGYSRDTLWKFGKEVGCPGKSAVGRCGAPGRHTHQACHHEQDGVRVCILVGTVPGSRCDWIGFRRSEILVLVRGTFVDFSAAVPSYISRCKLRSTVYAWQIRKGVPAEI